MSRSIPLILVFCIIVLAVSLDDLTKEGVALRDAGKYDEAILKFQQVLSSKPKHAGANYELGQTYLKKSDGQNAVKYFKDALDFGYDEVKCRTGLGLANIVAENYSEAVAEFQILTQLQPNNPEFLTLYADASLQGGTSGLAEDLYRQALKANSSYVPAMFGLANFFRNKRMADSTLSYYKKVKATQPDYAQVYLALGTFYAEKKDSVKSFVEINKYMQLKPKDYNGPKTMADIYVKMKNYKNAELYQLKAISLGDTATSSLRFLAFIDKQLKKWPEHKEILKQIVLRTPDDVAVWKELAEAYTKLDSAAGANQAYAQVVRIDTTYIPTIAFERGLVYYSLTKYDSAIAWFTKKVQYDSISAGPYFNRAIAYYQLKKYKETIKDLEKYLKLKPKSVQAWVLLSQTYWFDSNKQAAIKACKEALKLDPKNKDANKLMKELKRPPKKTYEDYWDYGDE